MRFPRFGSLALAASLLAGCQGLGIVGKAHFPPNALSLVPASAPARGPFVAAANPLAVQTGLAVLSRGGSAVDAAVAIQAVLGLVEPQSSGLGGGAFMMVYDAATKEITAYDGRETAPAAATPELFYEDGKPLPFQQAVLSGRSTGVPGAVAMLGLAQKEHGKLPWGELFGDAERLARDGFVISPRLAGMIAAPADHTQGHTRWANAYFTKPDGTRYVAGDVLKNPEYADTVATLARDGAQALYEGPVAEAIVAATHENPSPGSLTIADMAAYTPIERGALCRPFRVYVICVPPPPSSGVALLQLMEMMVEY